MEVNERNNIKQVEEPTPFRKNHEQESGRFIEGEEMQVSTVLDRGIAFIGLFMAVL